MRARAGEEGENSLLSLHLSIFPSLSPSTTTAAVRLRRLDQSTVREATPPRAAARTRATRAATTRPARARRARAVVEASQAWKAGERVSLK